MILRKHVFVMICIFLLPGCNTWQGHNGMSEDIEESKRRGVFVSEYYSELNPYVINDSLRLNVKTAWLEKRWKYPSNPSETVIWEGYQLIIHVDKENLRNYAKTWLIGLDFNLNLRSCGYSCLMMDCDTIPLDRITWKVQQGRRLDSLITKNIIGEFSLVKK